MHDEEIDYDEHVDPLTSAGINGYDLARVLLILPSYLIAGLSHTVAQVDAILYFQSGRLDLRKKFLRQGSSEIDQMMRGER